MIGPCPLLAHSRHQLVHRTCLLMTQSGHCCDSVWRVNRNYGLMQLEAGMHFRSISKSNAAPESIRTDSSRANKVAGRS
jgi:hypothetical protein